MQQRTLGLHMVAVELNAGIFFKFVNLSGVCEVIALLMKADKVATKDSVEKTVHESIKDLATKESIKDLATKESIKDLATKDSVEKTVHESVKDLATKKSFQKTRTGLLYLANSVNGLRAEKQSDTDKKIFDDDED